MRVTSEMMHSRVTFNMQRALQRYLDLQTQMSSGKRINTASDDPVGTQRALIYRGELSAIEQYGKNISEGVNLMDSYDSVLGELKDLISSANEIAVEMSNDTYDAIARAGSAGEIDAIFDRIMQLSNRTLQGRYLFSGFRTDQASLSAHTNGVSYHGDDGKISFQVDTASQINVNVLGTDVFLKRLSSLGDGTDLKAGIANGTLLSTLNDGNGVDLTPATFTVTDKNTGTSATINLTGVTAVSDVLTAVNAQLALAGMTNIVAKIGSERNNLLFDTSANGLVSVNTSLNVLNSGSGVDKTPGRFLVTDGSGTNVQIDVSSAQTVGDVITMFNTQMTNAGVNNVTMALNGSNTGFVINDTNGSPLNLRIQEIDTIEQTAQSLGILGNIGASLAGEPLDPTVAFEITEAGGTVAADLGIKGLFFNDFPGTDLNPRITADMSLSQLNNGLGFPLGTITVTQGEWLQTIDLAAESPTTVQELLDIFNTSGLNITASLNAQGTGIQIVNNDPTRSLLIEDSGNGLTSKNLGIYGSTDMMGSVLALSNALKRNDQDGISRLLKNMDDSIQNLLNNRASVGARTIRLESTNKRLTDLSLGYTRLLSETEDADITKLVTDLASFETNYRASINAAARIIQPTLLDFLR